MWRGHKINYVSAGCGKPVLLVHGFGASWWVGSRLFLPFISSSFILNIKIE
jgi:pimeloyl-ACP methyl ester carboxylesterase